MISPRGQFLAAFLATVAGIAALSWYGFVALESAAADGVKLHGDIERLQAASDIEEDVRFLGVAPEGPDADRRLRRIDRNLARLEVDPVAEDLPHVAELQEAISAAKRQHAGDAWVMAGVATGRVEESIIDRSRKWSTTEQARKRARRLLQIGAGIVLLIGAASAVVFLRWQRQERDARERVRRSDRLAALGTIAASVAHEIHNPLATISGCASAVRDRVKRQKEPCADSIEYLEMIEDETRRCTGIVKNLGDLAREGPPATAPADLAKLARSVVALLELDRKAKQVVFAVEGEDHVEAICDPDKIKQLLLNLLINARDASPAGGEVTVCVTSAGPDTARIEVVDGGRGIEKKDLHRIFEPFHTDKTQGLGIGLFLCERIVASHGGTIRAFSEGRGYGARFLVEFPTRTSGTTPAAAVS